MKKYIVSILLVSVILTFKLSAQTGNVMDYQRSSLYTMLVNSPKPMAKEIKTAFLSIPLSDKFNDHNLSLRLAPIYAVPQEQNDKGLAISQFLEDNKVARRMVAKWFLRDKATGCCSFNQIIERGLYNANEIDMEVASLSKRGDALLSDGGVDLIGSTFLVVNDISYIDKERNAKISASVFKILAAVAGAVADVAGASGDNSTESIANLVELGADLGGAISNAIAGFTVNTTSYLYQLKWSKDEYAIFSDYYWADTTMTDEEILAKKIAFEKSINDFKLTYVDSFTAKSMKTVLRGLHTNEDVIRKVCARAIDKNIVALQKGYEPFRVKVPVTKLAVRGNKRHIGAYIGMKEGMDENTKYEVLERRKDRKGNISYKRVGVVKPLPNKVWDNRFMALEEEAKGANLGFTTFRVVSGSNIQKGMYLREIIK